MKINLFRGKVISRDEWKYGNLCDDSDGMFISESGCYGWTAVYPETVARYTGYIMQDNKVFFNDLVSNNYQTDKETIRQVVMHEGTIMLKRIKGKSRLPEYISIHEYHNFNYRVIGNIHDNIELL